MQLLKRFVIFVTLISFVCSATGCATNGRGVAPPNLAHHGRSNVEKTVDEEDSSGYSTGAKALAIGAGVVLLVGALALVAANSGSQGIGHDIAANIGRGT
jgi:hypothetical protein